MRRSSVATAVVGLGFSLLVSVAAWIYLDSLLLFLFLPFVPFLFRGRGTDDREAAAVSRCPRCGFETTDPSFEYCPRDGARLERDRNGP